jgi:hypothetical protein
MRMVLSLTPPRPWESCPLDAQLSHLSEKFLSQSYAFDKVNFLLRRTGFLSDLHSTKVSWKAFKCTDLSVLVLILGSANLLLTYTGQEKALDSS